MIVQYENIIDRADTVMTASSVFNRYPLSNLFDDRLSRKTRLGVGYQWLQISLSEEVAVDICAIAGANFETAQFQASNDPSFSNTVANITFTKSTGKVIFCLTQEIRARYFRVIVDTISTKNIGKISIGKTVILPGIAADAEINDTTTEEMERSKSGQGYPTDGYQSKDVSVNFPYVSDEDAIKMNQMWNQIRNVKTFFAIVWMGRQRVLPMLYCSLNQKTFSIQRSGSIMSPNKTKLSLMEAF